MKRRSPAKKKATKRIVEHWRIALLAFGGDGSWRWHIEGREPEG